MASFAARNAADGDRPWSGAYRGLPQRVDRGTHGRTQIALRV